MHSTLLSTRFYSSLALVPILLGGLFACAQSPECETDCLTAKIVEARNYTAQYVVLAKQSFKPNSAEYNQAFKLYASAYAKYSAWDAYVASALRAGRAKKLNNDKNYDATASSASQSSSAFTNYVDSKTTGESKAVVTILSSLADLGLKLWNGISQHVDSERTAAADAFTSATKWQAWNEITDGSAPKVDSSNGTTSKEETKDSSKPTPSDTGKPKTSQPAPKPKPNA